MPALPFGDLDADRLVPVRHRPGTAAAIARRDEIVAELGRPEGSVKRWLAIMRDHGLITASGSTRAARYYLPEHAPDAGDAPADDDAA